MKRTALKRSTKPMKRTRLRPVSMKRHGQRDTYVQTLIEVVLRDGPECWVGTWGLWSEVDCAGRVDPHHVHPQSRFPERRCDPEAIRLVCRAHHNAIHDHPIRARGLGLLV